MMGPSSLTAAVTHYDNKLANRTREYLNLNAGLTTKKFGGSHEPFYLTTPLAIGQSAVVRYSFMQNEQQKRNNKKINIFVLFLQEQAVQLRAAA